ncbi:Protein kinase of the Mitotic Exit Network [Balamuthia mandrillaris]
MEREQEEQPSEPAAREERKHWGSFSPSGWIPLEDGFASLAGAIEEAETPARSTRQSTPGEEAFEEEEEDEEEEDDRVSPHRRRRRGRRRSTTRGRSLSPPPRTSSSASLLPSSSSSSPHSSSPAAVGASLTPSPSSYRRAFSASLSSLVPLKGSVLLSPSLRRKEQQQQNNKDHHHHRTATIVPAAPSNDDDALAGDSARRWDKAYPTPRSGEQPPSLHLSPPSSPRPAIQLSAASLPSVSPSFSPDEGYHQRPQRAPLVLTHSLRKSEGKPSAEKRMLLSSLQLLPSQQLQQQQQADLVMDRNSATRTRSFSHENLALSASVSVVSEHKAAERKEQQPANNSNINVKKEENDNKEKRTYTLIEALRLAMDDEESDEEGKEEAGHADSLSARSVRRKVSVPTPRRPKSKSLKDKVKLPTSSSGKMINMMHRLQTEKRQPKQKEREVMLREMETTGRANTVLLAKEEEKIKRKDRSKESTPKQAITLKPQKHRKPASDLGDSVDELIKPESIGPYHVGPVIGRGFFGVVYKALNVETGDFVAIKRLDLRKLDVEQIMPLMKEVELMKSFHHPQIVRYINAYEEDGFLSLVLEFMENGSLHDIQRKFGVFPESLVAAYLSQILLGLEYLHAQSVVHRDIKGSNILITKTGICKLADFGTSCQLDIGSGEKRFSIAGSPYWMAPEVVEKSGVSLASDIWSLGCTVIELLSGGPPYHKKSPMAAMYLILQNERPPFPADISQEMKHFLECCFHREPEKRATATQLLSHPFLLKHATHTQTKSFVASSHSSSPSQPQSISPQAVQALLTEYNLSRPASQQVENKPDTDHPALFGEELPPSSLEERGESETEVTPLHYPLYNDLVEKQDDIIVLSRLSSKHHASEQEYQELMLSVNSEDELSGEEMKHLLMKTRSCLARALDDKKAMLDLCKRYKNTADAAKVEMESSKLKLNVLQQKLIQNIVENKESQLQKRNHFLLRQLTHLSSHIPDDMLAYATLGDLSTEAMLKDSTFSGYLFKQSIKVLGDGGAHYTNWKHRFFVLKYNFLAYFKSDKETSPLKVCCLDNFMLQYVTAIPNEYIFDEGNATMKITSNINSHQHQHGGGESSSSSLSPSSSSSTASSASDSNNNTGKTWRPSKHRKFCFKIIAKTQYLEYWLASGDRATLNRWYLECLRSKPWYERGYEHYDAILTSAASSSSSSSSSSASTMEGGGGGAAGDRSLLGKASSSTRSVRNLPLWAKKQVASRPG